MWEGWVAPPLARPLPQGEGRRTVATPRSLLRSRDTRRSPNHRHASRDLRPHRLVELGQRPCRAVARPDRGPARPWPRGRVLRARHLLLRAEPRPRRAAPGRSPRALPRLARRRRRRRPHRHAGGSGHRHLLLPRRAGRDRDARLPARPAPLLLRPRHPRDARAGRRRDAGRLPRPRRPPLLRPRAQLHRRRRADRPARHPRRPPRGTAVWLGRSRGLRARRADGADRGTQLSRHLRRRPAGDAGDAVRPPRPGAPHGPLRHRRRPVSAGLPLDGEHLLRPPRAARRPPRLLREQPHDAERHPRRDGAHGLVPLGPSVRGGLRRRPHPLRLVAGPGRVLPPRPGHPDRRGHRRGAGGAGGSDDAALADIAASARARVLARHTAGHRADELLALVAERLPA